MGVATLLLGLLLLSALTAKSTVQAFNCTSPATCHALIDYVSPNATTLSVIKTLFGVKKFDALLGANNLPLSTPANQTVDVKQKVRIPFPCRCANNTGSSNNVPIYTVQKDDGLWHIAAQIFSGLLEFVEIARVNNISGPDYVIQIGQKLWVPLPCSCDTVDGASVVHYGHVVENGSTLDVIAEKYETKKETLMRLNAITDESKLLAGQVLDVPLKACTSAVSNRSSDYPLLVSNGTYVLTANNCIMCKCDSANNWTLQCQPSQLKPSNGSSCASMMCDGTSNLYIGNTSISTSCNRTTCAYSGYTGQTILTTLDTVSTCPAPANNASKTRLQGLKWGFLVHLALLCLLLLSK